MREATAIRAGLFLLKFMKNQIEEQKPKTSFSFPVVEGVDVFLNRHNGVTIQQIDTDGSENVVFLSSLDRLKEVVSALLSLSTVATFKPEEDEEEAP